ncbi:MAG TPA: HDIG domain-containing protein [Anaerolineae bacterium]|nr:HDIG domain-containing protein [Anaerolineae bacterium]
MQPTREDAWALLNEYTKSPNLIKHALAVEAAMRAYARRFGEDEELWGVVGLVHDFDYEQHPTAEEHPFAGAEILRRRGWPEEIIRAVLSHASYAGVTRDSLMEKTLFAVDELTGLIVAVALVRPSKSIFDVKVKSVRKKWKDKSFAAGVNRGDIEQGAAELGVELREHIGVVLEAMKGIADDLGLRGTA